jgi:hypothetical protein
MSLSVQSNANAAVVQDLLNKVQAAFDKAAAIESDASLGGELQLQASAKAVHDQLAQPLHDLQVQMQALKDEAAQP